MRNEKIVKEIKKKRKNCKHEFRYSKDNGEYYCIHCLLEIKYEEVTID